MHINGKISLMMKIVICVGLVKLFLCIIMHSVISNRSWWLHCYIFLLLSFSSEDTKQSATQLSLISDVVSMSSIVHPENDATKLFVCSRYYISNTL